MNWDDNNTYFFYFHDGGNTLKDLKEYVDALIKNHGENAKIELQGDYDGMVHYEVKK